MFPKIKSSFLHKCPRCLEGDMFPDRNAYHLKQTANMHQRCPSCGLNFSPEPGYFYGAMYVSYAFTIAIGVALFLIDYLFFWNLGIAVFLIAFTVVLLSLAPYTFRTSRAIWLNFFHRYDPNWKEKYKVK
jgi:uncharacterized protein (DUF983 family)